MYQYRRCRSSLQVFRLYRDSGTYGLRRTESLGSTQRSRSRRTCRTILARRIQTRSFNILVEPRIPIHHPPRRTSHAPPPPRRTFPPSPPWDIEPYLTKPLNKSKRLEANSSKQITPHLRMPEN